MEAIEAINCDDNNKLLACAWVDFFILELSRKFALDF